jgi:MSHA pilin protein MshA
MKQSTKGFTITELIIVLIILGVLSVFAVPRFIDLVRNKNSITNAKDAAAALTSANETNYKTRKSNSSSGVAISNCKDVVSVLPGGTLPENYDITSTVVPVNTKVTCTVTGPEDTATFTATGIK